VKLPTIPPISDSVPAPKLPGTKRFPWLGNKQSEPRMRGAGKAHRMKQLNASAYPTVKLSQLKKV